MVTNNATLIQLAYDQCRLYRTALRDPSTGLWQHIVLGSWQDYGIWGTGEHSTLTQKDWTWAHPLWTHAGNAWAAAGMIRVLATIQNSPFAASFTTQTALLSTWINSILTITFLKLGVRHRQLVKLLHADPSSMAVDRQPLAKLLQHPNLVHVLRYGVFHAPRGVRLPNGHAESVNVSSQLG